MRKTRNRRLLIRKKKYIRLFFISLLIILVSSIGYYHFLTKPIFTICIDPGHGGYDTGAISEDFHFNEKDLVLDVSLKLGKLLKDENIKVVYTRDTDTTDWNTQTKSLRKRCEISNRAHADIFMSIHGNAFPHKKEVHGIEVWCRFKDTEDEKLAKEISHRLSAIGFTQNRGLRYEKDKGLYVLRHTTATAVLVELGYLTNPKDALFIHSEKGKNQCAQALYEAVMNYYHAQNTESDFK